MLSFKNLSFVARFLKFFTVFLAFYHRLHQSEFFFVFLSSQYFVLSLSKLSLHIFHFNINYFCLLRQLLKLLIAHMLQMLQPEKKKLSWDHRKIYIYFLRLTKSDPLTSTAILWLSCVYIFFFPQKNCIVEKYTRRKSSSSFTFWNASCKQFREGKCFYAHCSFYFF